MNDQELRSGGPPERFDNTMLATRSTCHRQLYWFLRGLDYKSVPAYFVYGRAFGTAANVWHSRNGEEPISRLTEALLAAEKIWQEESPIEFEKNTWEDFKSLFKQYASHYGPTEPWSMIYGKGEKGFSLPMPGAPEGCEYCGAIDAPILWEPYGMMPREDKTTGSWVNVGYLAQWDFSTQVTGYHWAFETVIGPCAGVYMNIAGKTPRFEGVGKNKVPAPGLRFNRYLTSRTPDEQKRFVEETCRLMEEIWREWDHWNWDKTGKRNPMNCTGGMGKKRCLYSSLCKLDVEPWELEEYNFLDEFSWRGKWAPWERDGED